MNPVFAGLSTTIFEVMSGLARRHGAVNLGQGFPDNPGPEDVRAHAAQAVLHGSNQYPPMLGLPELRAAVAEHYRAHQGLDLDPATEVFVTSGATEALAAALFALISPGDEVIVFEPLYDLYVPIIRRAGGVPRIVTLRPPAFQFTREALEAELSDRTRLLLVNTPHNPAVVSFGAETLALVAEVCVRRDLLVLSDEVWEHLVFDGRRHLPLMSAPGLRDRTVKVGSAGKIFSLTGWKVGWVCAAPPLAAAVAKAHQFLAFTTPPNLQSAVAYGLGKDLGWFTDMRAGYQRARNRLATGLKQEGFAVLPSAGAYFLNIDLPGSGVDVDDETFCRRAVEEAGVAAIPVSAFYERESVRTLVRLCFAKRDETLDLGVQRLATARKLFR
jgi:aspartate/methionine/tyrosine aminotransferase